MTPRVVGAAEVIAARVGIEWRCMLNGTDGKDCVSLMPRVGKTSYHLTFGLTESTRAIVATGTRLCPDNAADGTGKGKYTQVGQGESHGYGRIKE